MKSKKPNILFYDIETTPMRIWTFSLGKTILSHKQIVKGDKLDIICICYKWAHQSKPHKLHWGYYKQDSKKMIEDFDKIIKKADVAIAQNGDRFDVRHINTQRMLHDLPPMPDWRLRTDDLLKQMRKYFYFPSYSLDYVSKLLLGQGKVKMELEDWTDILEKKDKKKFNKMIDYCAKDVTDMEKIWNRLKSHIIPKFNYSAYQGIMSCRVCGSEQVKKHGSRTQGKTRYIKFECLEHKGYAGQLTESQVRSWVNEKDVVMG